MCGPGQAVVHGHDGHHLHHHAAHVSGGLCFLRRLLPRRARSMFVARTLHNNKCMVVLPHRFMEQ